MALGTVEGGSWLNANNTRFNLDDMFSTTIIRQALYQTFDIEEDISDISGLVMFSQCFCLMQSRQVDPCQ